MEYVVQNTGNHTVAHHAFGSPKSILKSAMALFLRHGNSIPFSMPYTPAGGRLDPLSAEDMCKELGLRVVDGGLHIDASELEPALAPQMNYPASHITFTVPLSESLCDRAYAFARFEEFRPRLRVALLPLTNASGERGQAAVRSVGLHLNIPHGVSDSSLLQSRFCQLLELARTSRLQVLVGGADIASDYWWIRQFDRVQQYGNLLSPVLSADCLEAMLHISNPSWRNFRVSGRYALQHATPQARRGAETSTSVVAQAG
ncbi:hypothetical protein ACCM60_19225 [Pseudomonas chlororaphis subsp. aureofaciens]|uniref:hypothetical protein n=1 Tax=Pseudomonas TaxID=286 RepID=UPI00235F1C8D|nr:hypothetical protein [Pseudomonas sp. SBT1-2]